MAASDRVPVTGSERSLTSGHTRVGDVDPQATVDLTVYVRPRAPADWVDAESARAPMARRLVAREDWADLHGAADEDMNAVASFARDAGLAVVRLDSARRAAHLRGSLQVASDAFGATMEGRFEAAEGRGEYRARTGALTVPAALGDVVVGVFGIDDRPQARPHLRRHAKADAGTSFTPVQVAEAYAFPPGATGKGQNVGILELGGGFSTDDLTTYFTGLGLTAPSVTAVSVDGGQNSPGTDPNSDGEVMLDIEVVGAVAPDVAIAVYFAPNTDQGFIDALSTAVHDTTHKPSVISVSWGESEDAWSAQARTQMEQVLTEAAGLGVTVTVASGDNGSTDAVSDGQQHVDFPASAPHALACGGTSLRASGTTINSETVWNDPGDGATGGGISRQFAVPSYQANAKLPVNVDTQAAGRGVPDVCGDADPQTGYVIRVDGADETIGGTSAVAPLWAGLIARLDEQLGAPLGFVQPLLYPLLGSDSFHDITSGDNGSYAAGTGWDACTGLGSPDGTALAAAVAPSGTGAGATG
ncbi:MAG TPA: S53 family peptidase [Solirubrobacteraceae bacterium]|jgi:kumamolisin|nr:S53 family peptidase [Solirubrobacteraceae bacterium]